ncbi:MAG: efflux RND transporter permease subunit [Gammaproteobacteria bacterium]|nr:efflux RND transporter permease subunit [Gammaproteobacteria bacterium]
MKISEVCIYRPVLATVLSLVVILFGVLGFFHLDTRYFPKIEQHVIVIDTDYPGASSQLIEKTVNSPIEDAMSIISGIDSLTSSATQGEGKVKIKFVTGVDFSEKASEVRDKLSSIRSLLPEDIDAPAVKISDNTDFLLNIAITDANLAPAQIRDYVEHYVKDKIQEINGVGDIDIWGSSEYAMRIWLNAQKLAAYNLTVQDIRTAIENSNVQSPAGEFKSLTMSFPITEDTQLKSSKEFNQLIIFSKNGRIVRLKDVGRAELGLQDDPFYARINGETAVGINVYLDASGNPIDTSAALHSVVQQLKNSLPSGMKIQIPQDMSRFFKAAVHEVYLSIFLAVLCVLFVIVLFLGDLRSVSIPVVTIPICVIGAFGVIAAFNFSINLLTLLAIVLSIGLVVDDAIVMLENIYRHIEKGVQPFKAALVGSNEITFSIIAMSLTLIAVYAPIGFMQTRTAILFREFSFTLAGAVFISGFVALTLTPSMCAMMLKPVKKQNLYAKKLEQFFDVLRKRYGQLLTYCIHKRIIVLLICLAIATGGGFLFHSLPKDFMPKEDTGMIFGPYTTATGSNSTYTLNFTKQLEGVCSANSNIQTVYSFTWQNNSNLFLLLSPIEKRKKSANQISNDLMMQVHNIPGLSGFFFPMSFSSGMRSHDLNLEIMSTGDYESLYRTSQILVAKLKQIPGLTNVDSDMKFDSQQYDIQLDRDQAQTEGINVKEIDETLAILLGGSHITDFYLGNNSYQVIVQAQATDLADPSAIQRFYMRGLSGKMVPLNELVSLKSIVTQSSLNHYDRLRATEITAQLLPGYKLSSIVQLLQSNLSGWLPSDMKYAFEGKTKYLLETSSDMNLIFVLALVFIYLILAALFESFIDPFVILFTVPLSVIGGGFALWLIGGSLNIYTDIGLVTLVGLITKHGILITRFANQRLGEGMSITTAITEAATLRLRPILMTTGAMVLGALPLALATGSGANSRMQIGWVIISGLMFGTFFSLILVPIAYTYLAHFKRNRGALS